MHIMMPILAKFYPFLYLRTGTNIHDILNISIFQFHSSTKDLNNEHCKRTHMKEHLKRVNYMVGIWKRAHIAKPVYPQPTHDNGWQCVDGMLNNEHCKRTHSIENWRSSSH
jgi:hypothetical protein